jgi:hypothetical protein
MDTRRAFAILVLSGTALGADWQYSIGVHDFVVPEADSDTFGIDGRATYDERTSSGRHYFGSADVFVDRDQDHLDPDHIPVWWQLHAGTDGDLWRSGAAHIGWTADIHTRMNTVSSIERRITARPALVLAEDGERFDAALKAGAGWFFLEIDDDVPKTRGYERGDFRNNELAYSLAADATLRLGKAWSASGQAQGLWSSQQWLQTEYKAALRFDAGSWHEGSELVLDADYNTYNLDPYTRSGLPSILPWDHDVMFRITLDDRW